MIKIFNMAKPKYLSTFGSGKVKFYVHSIYIYIYLYYIYFLFFVFLHLNFLYFPSFSIFLLCVSWGNYLMCLFIVEQWRVNAILFSLLHTLYTHTHNGGVASSATLINPLHFSSNSKFSFLSISRGY